MRIFLNLHWSTVVSKKNEILFKSRKKHCSDCTVPYSLTMIGNACNSLITILNEDAITDDDEEEDEVVELFDTDLDETRDDALL